MLRSVFAAVLLTSASVLCASGANLVANSAFDTGDFSDWTIGGPELATNGGPSGGVPANGSQFIGVSPTLGPGIYPAFDGDTYYAYFSGGGASSYYSLSQAITTTAGQPYTITFWLANDTTPDTAHGYMNYVQGLFGSGAATFLDIPGTPSASTYNEYIFYGLASSSSTDLILNIDNEAGYFDLDNVTVTAGAPEPATLLLLAPALAAFFGLRKRKA